MKFILFCLFVSDAFCGGLAFFPKSPFFFSSEKEDLEDRKFMRLDWSEKDQERLDEINREQRRQAHNAFQRALAKAGVISNPAILGSAGAQEAQGLAPQIGQVLELPAQPITGAPSMILMPGSPAGGGSEPPGGGSETVTAVAPEDIPAPNQYTGLKRDKLKREIDLLLRDSESNRENLYLAFQELLILARVSVDAEDDFVAYCRSHSSLLRKFGDEDLLRYSIMLGKLEIARSLIEKGCYINAPSLKRNIRPTEEAIRCRKFDIFNFLVNRPEFDPNTVNPAGFPLIQQALDARANLFISSILSHPAFRMPEVVRVPNELSGSLIYGLIVAVSELGQIEQGLVTPDMEQSETTFDGLVRLGHARGVSFLLERHPELASANNSRAIKQCFQNIVIASEEDDVPLMVRQNLAILSDLLKANPALPTETLLKACQQGLSEFVWTWVLLGEIPEQFYQDLSKHGLSPLMLEVIENARLIREPNRLFVTEADQRAELVTQERESCARILANLRDSCSMTVLSKEQSNRRALETLEENENQALIRQEALARQVISENQNALERQRRIDENQCKLMLESLKKLAGRVSQEPAHRTVIEEQEHGEFAAILVQARQSHQAILQEQLARQAERDAIARRFREAEARERARVENDELQIRSGVAEQLEAGVKAVLRGFEGLRTLFGAVARAGESPESLLLRAVQVGPGAVRTLLVDEDGALRSWTPRILKNREAAQKAIENKNLSVLREILPVMERLGISPVSLLRHSFELSKNSKKGSDEIRIFKEVKESCLRVLKRLVMPEEGFAATDIGTAHSLLEFMKANNLLPQEDWVKLLPLFYSHRPYHQ